MNWLASFRARLVVNFNWTPPASEQELETRLNSGAFFLEVPDVLWAYACGQSSFAQAYDNQSPWENLRSQLNHQGSVRPETAPAIHFVLQIARHLPDAPQVDLLMDALWYGTGDQNYHLPWGWPTYQEIKEHDDDPYHAIAAYYALKREAQTIREIAASDDLDVKAMALWTLSFIPHEAENVALVRTHWNHENPTIRRLAMLSLARLGAELTSDETRILQQGLASDGEHLRLICAMSLAIDQLLRGQSPSDTILNEICAVRKFSLQRLADTFGFDAEIDVDAIAHGICEAWREKEPERIEAAYSEWQ